MRKIVLSIIILILLLGLSFTAYYTFWQKESENVASIDINKVNEQVEKEETTNNPIRLSLYKYYGHNQNRKKVTEYESEWQYHTDISSFEVFFTEDEEINGDYLQNTFKTYYDTYTNIDEYKIGYRLSFTTTEGIINKTILSPKDTEDFFSYLEVYLYDDYHREIGVWYSHTLESEMTDDTLLTSIKLTAGKLVDEITSDITLEVFTYIDTDISDDGNYLGNNMYQIIVKRK